MNNATVFKLGTLIQRAVMICGVLTFAPFAQADTAICDDNGCTPALRVFKQIADSLAPKDMGDDNTNATGNTVSINVDEAKQPTILYVYGANRNDDVDVSDNTVTLISGLVEGGIDGASTRGGDALRNTVNVSGGFVDGKIIAGASPSGNANQNIVNFSNKVEELSTTTAGIGEIAKDNVVAIKDISVVSGISDEVKLVGAQSSHPTNNKINIENTKINLKNNLEIYAAASPGSAFGNAVTIKDTNIDTKKSDLIVAASEVSYSKLIYNLLEMTNNSVLLDDVAITGQESIISGNYLIFWRSSWSPSDAQQIIVKGNNVTIKNSQLTTKGLDASIAGLAIGSANGDPLHFNPTNQAIISNNSIIISDSHINGDVVSIVVDLSDGNKNRFNIDSVDNSIVVNNSVIQGDISGKGATKLSQGNSVEIANSHVTEKVTAAGSENGNVIKNQAIIKGSHIDGDVLGGKSLAGNAIDNRVMIENSHIHGKVFGGVSQSGIAINNSVTISGGQIYSDVFGGFSETGSATNNTVTISNSSQVPTFSDMGILYGGYVKSPTSGSDARSGNTLNLHTTGVKLNNIQNFERLNFYLQPNTKQSATFLSLSGSEPTDIRNTQIGVGIEGNDTLLNAGNSVTLIKKTGNSQLLTDAQLNNNITGMQGISTLYDFELEKLNDQTLVATLIKGRINPQTKSLSEARLAALASLTQGADFLANQGINGLVQATQNVNNGDNGMSGFAALGSSKTRANTGSHIDVKSTNLLIGASQSWSNSSGQFSLGGFFENGYNSYDSYNDFSDQPSVRGYGKSRYYGIGLMAQQTFNNNWFVDGSVRIGQAHLDYHSDDLSDVRGNKAHFSSKSTYTGVNLGLGYTAKLSEKSTLTPYGKVLWTHYGDTEQTIIGTKFAFDKVDSLRTQLGAKIQYAWDDKKQFYADLAWEHEHLGRADGKALFRNATLDLPSPSLKGDTGIVGVGLQLQPKNNMHINLGVQGSFGLKQGMEANAKIKYDF